MEREMERDMERDMEEDAVHTVSRVEGEEMRERKE